MNEWHSNWERVLFVGRNFPFRQMDIPHILRSFRFQQSQMIEWPFVGMWKTAN